MNSKKIMGDVDFKHLSRNELYSLCTNTMHAMERLNGRLLKEQRDLYRRRIDYNCLTKEELYRLTTIVVYSLRRLLKRLDKVKARVIKKNK